MTDIARIGNQIEAVLWFLFSLGCAVMVFRTTGRARRLAVILCVAYAAFGTSDLIEAQTGAWWRPLWLLVLKGVCLGVIGWGFVEFRRIRSTAGR